MSKTKDLCQYATAYEARSRLPELASWMSDDDLKLLPIWHGKSFERGQIYFDLDNPERGPFAATGDEAWPADYTYVCRTEVPEQVWAKLVTWRQPAEARDGDSIAAQAEAEMAARPRPR